MVPPFTTPNPDESDVGGPCYLLAREFLLSLWLTSLQKAIPVSVTFGCDWVAIQLCKLPKLLVAFILTFNECMASKIFMCF